MARSSASRAAVAFAFVYLLTRVIGRRELSSLQPFDLIMLVMIGDLVQQGVTQNDFSVTGALLVGAVVNLAAFELIAGRSGLAAALRREGFASVAEAVGTDA